MTVQISDLDKFSPSLPVTNASAALSVWAKSTVSGPGCRETSRMIGGGGVGACVYIQHLIFIALFPVYRGTCLCADSKQPWDVVSILQGGLGSRLWYWQLGLLSTAVAVAAAAAGLLLIESKLLRKAVAGVKRG